MCKNAVCIMALVVFTVGCSPAPAPPSINLNEAAYQGNLEAVQQHIRAGSDLNRKTDDGATPLIAAATFGHADVAKALIEAGADLNLVNNEGSTALLSAAFLCRTEIVELLLDNGADKNIRNNAGSTALDSVAGPFEDIKPVYELVEAVLGPLGLTLDYEHIKTTRPIIAAMLR